MRFAFTILLNAAHHLDHDDYFEKTIPLFDKWVFAEGAVENNDSTGWCRGMPEGYHDGKGHSIDGTMERLHELQAKFPDRVVIAPHPGRLWRSKDEQVNACVFALRRVAHVAFLWQMDADEQWAHTDISEVERRLENSGAREARVEYNHFVGDGLVAEGKWGGGTPTARCWSWHGEYFGTHEPPVLDTGRPVLFVDIRDVRFNHYSYVFEKDVLFKSKWYAGHENVYEGWKKLKTATNFPVDGREFFGNDRYDFKIVRKQ